MVKSTITESALALGKELIEQAEFKHDALGRWMALDLAGKLEAHRKTRGSARTVLEEEIRSIIFMFWEHRRSLTHARPFDGFDRVINLLDNLDPTSSSGFYFDYSFREKEKQQPGHAWLDRARDFDRGARSLINYCISRGAVEAGKPSQAWLDLAKAVPDKADSEARMLVRFVSVADEVDEDVDLNAPERAKLERMIRHLDAMVNHAKDVKMHLKERIREFPAQWSNDRLLRPLSLTHPSPRKKAYGQELQQNANRRNVKRPLFRRRLGATRSLMSARALRYICGVWWI